MTQFETNNSASKNLPKLESDSLPNPLPTGAKKHGSFGKTDAEIKKLVEKRLREQGAQLLEVIEEADGIPIKTVFRASRTAMKEEGMCVCPICLTERTIIRCMTPDCENFESTLLPMAFVLRAKFQVRDESLVFFHTDGCPKCSNSDSDIVIVKIAKCGEWRFENPTED